MGLLQTPSYEVVTLGQIGVWALSKKEFELTDSRMFDYFEFFTELQNEFNASISWTRKMKLRL